VEGSDVTWSWDLRFCGRASQAIIFLEYENRYGDSYRIEFPLSYDNKIDTWKSVEKERLFTAVTIPGAEKQWVPV
jgi:hypothetical protein